MGEYEDTLWEIYLKVEFCWNAGTVCCGALVDTDEVHGTEIKTGDQLLACSNNCRKFVAIATA